MYYNNLPQPQSLHLEVAEACYMLSLLLAVLSCIYSFWHGGIPTFLMIYIYLYILYIIKRTYVREAIGSCNGALLNGNRSRRLGSYLVKEPGLFDISCTLKNEAALYKNYLWAF